MPLTESASRAKSIDAVSPSGKRWEQSATIGNCIVADSKQIGDISRYGSIAGQWANWNFRTNRNSQSRGLSMANFWMVPFLIVCWWQAPQTSHDETKQARSVTAIRLDAECFTKKLKREKELAGQTAIILDLCWLHQEIVDHPAYDQTPQLQNVRAQVANLLKRFLRELDLANKRRARESSDAMSAANGGHQGSNSARSPSGSNDAVRSEGTLSNKSNGREGFNRSSSSGAASEVDEYDLAEWSRRQGFQWGQALGGGNAYFSYLEGNFAPPWDHGEELVDLITTTIDPKFWRRNGGAGIIHYYRPSRVLVVGGTIDIQDSVSGLLRQLRGGR